MLCKNKKKIQQNEDIHTYMHRETYQKLKEKTKLNID
jgi:hypothetical protein